MNDIIYGIDEDEILLHNLLAKILNALYENPEKLELPLDMDTAYGMFEVNNQKPEANAIYLEVHKKLYDFYRFLYVAARFGTINSNSVFIAKQDLKKQKVAVKSCYIDFLETLNIDITKASEGFFISTLNGKTLFATMKNLAEISTNKFNENDKFNYNYSVLFNFATANFTLGFNYLLQKIDILCAYDGLLEELRNTATKRGYRYEIGVSMSQTAFGFSIKLINGVGGFLITFNPRKYKKFLFGTQNGLGEKYIIEDFKNLDYNMQKHILNNTRGCNNCNSCTKGNKNKKFATLVNFNDENYVLCPQFPVHEWERFNDDLIDVLYKYHELQNLYTK